MTRHRTPTWRSAVTVTVACFLVLGLIAGWLWSTLAYPPEYLLVEPGHATYASEAEVGHAFETDLLFACAGAGAGLVGGVLVGWRYWSLGWLVVALGAAAAVGAGLVAWGTGLVLGPDTVATSVESARPGDTFTGPVTLGTWSILLSWPLATLFGVMVSVWLRAPREEAPAAVWTMDSPNGTRTPDPSS